MSDVQNRGPAEGSVGQSTITQPEDPRSVPRSLMAKETMDFSQIVL